ncbi:MAG: radical SAM protein [Polyangiaceae bacterium]|nr:radical SAM protein [Polyangiaceae bacterium]
MKRVAVLFAPLDVSRDFIDYPYFADLGAVQLAAVLRAEGREVSLVDALAMPGATLRGRAGDRVELGAPLDDFLARVPGDQDAYVVALTPFHRPPARDRLLGEVLQRLRSVAPRAPIVLADLYQSGQHVVDAPSEALAAAYPEIAAVLRYEAERDLGPLLDELATWEPGASPLLRRGVDLASLRGLPLPAWELVDVAAYFELHRAVVDGLGRPAWAFPIDGPSMPIVTSRGCPYRCVHCSSNPGTRVDGRQIAPKTQRRHPQDELDAALARLKALGAGRVHLLDELVNVNEAHFDGVLELLARHELAFEVPNGMRADYVLERHLSAMRGRLTTLSVSAESGSPRVVREIVDKQLDLADIERVAAGARAISLPTLVHFMIGLPGERRAEINETLDVAARLHEATGAFASVQFATPLPGTALAARAAEPGRRVLPVIGDFGPHFQRSPALETDEASLDALVAFREAYDERVRAADDPPAVRLYVTHRCNNRCSFCVVGTGPQVEEDLEAQLHALRALRREGARTLELTGGEPTLHPALFRLIAEARRLGYDDVRLVTNGRMASYPPFARRLARAGLSRVMVSLHGADAETHAAHVGVDEAFEQAQAGLAALARESPPTLELGVACAVTRRTSGSLREVADLAVRLGARHLSLQALAAWGGDADGLAEDPVRVGERAVQLAQATRGQLEVTVEHLPRCFVASLPELVAPRRRWVDVGDLSGHGRPRREKRDACAGCVHAVACAGFVVEGDAAPWLRGAAPQ